MPVAEPVDFWSVFSGLSESVGDRNAIIAPGRPPLRFADLPRRLESIRRALHHSGVGRGDRVVVTLPQGADMAVCYLGVAACATCVPLNPAYTEAELARILERIAPAAVVVPVGEGGVIRAVAATRGLPVIDLITGENAPAGTFVLQGPARPLASPAAWATAEDIALIVLTSASTEREKLVPLKHRQLLANARATVAHFALGPADRSLQVAPMFHAHALTGPLLGPLMAGGSMIVPPTIDVASVFAHLKAFRPTWMSPGYTLCQALFDAIDAYRDIARAAGLRFIATGGGVIEQRIVQGIEEAFGTPVVVRYAMSEAGNVTGNPLPPARRKPGTVGIAMGNEVRIIDESGARLGPNEPGEIVIRGPTVFEGYLDDPDGATVFVDGWFRTGDLGYLDDDGYLTLTGRVKQMINRGGEKVSPLEVEEVLSAHPAVHHVCVFGIEHPTLGEEVVAAVVPAPNALASEDVILGFARGRLVPFKVPRRIFFTSALPLGGAGKIDRRALARIYAAASPPPRDDTVVRSAPSALEVELAELWRAVLGVAVIGVGEDFFLAGGDSLKAARLFGRIGERFGVDLALRCIFEEGATVAGMARLIEGARQKGSHGRRLPAGLVPINTDGDRPPLFTMPGADGDPAAFMNLAGVIDARQPMYGPASFGLDGSCAPLDQIEAIAARNVALIRDFQRHGPYSLAGACVGAVVAYDMARQLQADGERVALLIMLDPPPPFTDARGRRRKVSSLSRIRTWTRLPRFVLARARLHGRTLARLPRGHRAAYVRERLRILRGIVAQRDIFRGDRSELNLIAVEEAHSVALRRYVPGPYDGPTVVYLTADRPVPGQRDHRLDWFSLVPQAGSPEYVPGLDSGDMLRPPHVAVLAERLSLQLARTL